MHHGLTPSASCPGSTLWEGRERLAIAWVHPNNALRTWVVIGGVPEPGLWNPCFVQSTSTAAARGLPRPHAQQSPLELAEAPEALPGQLHSIPAVSMQPLQHANAWQSLPEVAVAPQWLSGQLPSISAADTQPLHQPDASQRNFEAGLPARLPEGLTGNGRAQWQAPCLTEAAPHACISRPAIFRGQTSTAEHLKEYTIGAVQQEEHGSDVEARHCSRHGDAAAISRDGSAQDCAADSHAALVTPSEGKAWGLLKPLKSAAVCPIPDCTYLWLSRHWR